MLSDSEKVVLFDWLMTQMRGNVTVYHDGSREPQIAWSFPLDLWDMRGSTPPEAIRNAYEASQPKETH